MTTYTDVFGGDTVPPSQQGYKSWSITANQTTFWPELTDGSDTLADINEITTTAGLTFALPDAREA